MVHKYNPYSVHILYILSLHHYIRNYRRPNASDDDGRSNQDTLHVRGTNYCDIGYKLDAHNNRLIIISAIDNLVKGAAGQAVQNMNLMMGFDETAGLLQVPLAL